MSGQEQNLETSIASLRAFLYHNPTHVPAMFALADQLFQFGQIEESERGFFHITQRQPNHLSAWIKLGVLRVHKNDSASAELAFRKACQVDNTSAQAHRYLGMALMEQRRYAEAISPLQVATRLEFESSDNHMALGSAFYELGQYSEAARCYARAIRQSPLHELAWINLGTCWALRHEFRKAEACFRRTIQFCPESETAHRLLGIALDNQERLDAAEHHIRRAIELRPENPLSFIALAAIHEKRREYEQAEDCFRRTIELNPANAYAKFNLGTLHLRRGDWVRGLELYEHRLELNGQHGVQWSSPEWKGQSLENKTILVLDEQGIGDCVQFLRFLRVLRDRGARVCMTCRRSMLPLLKFFDGVDQWVPTPWDGPLPKHDFHVWLHSIPHVLGLTGDHRIAPCPYLGFSSERVARWKTRIDQMSGFKIGIVWKGNPQYLADQRRSAPLELFSGLKINEAVHFFALQKYGVEEDLQHVADRMAVTQFGEDLDQDGAFLDTAAIMQTMNLIISVDSAPAHVAGALGVPVWLILSYNADWRWMDETECSTWYPTMRIFRQNRRNDWTEVFQSMAIELKRQLSSDFRCAESVQKITRD